jgi:hypothetical protein
MPIGKRAGKKRPEALSQQRPEALSQQPPEALSQQRRRL